MSFFFSFDLGYGQWQMGERTHDEVFMAAQEAVGGPRDSQGKAHEANLQIRVLMS